MREQPLILDNAGFAAGLTDMTPLLIGVIPFGLIVGAVGAQVGLEVWELMMMSLVVFAGAAQFIALDMWGAPLAGAAIVGTTFLVNLRHVLMGAAARPHVRPLPAWVRVPFLYAMADENWAVAMRHARRHGGVSPTYIVGATLPMYVTWQVTCYIGTQVGGVIGDPTVWGFDFVFSAVFATLVFGFWRQDGRLAPIVASALMALAAYHGLPGKWYILLGGVAGVAAAIATFRRGSAP